MITITSWQTIRAKLRKISLSTQMCRWFLKKIRVWWRFSNSLIHHSCNHLCSSKTALRQRVSWAWCWVEPGVLGTSMRRLCRKCASMASISSCQQGSVGRWTTFSPTIKSLNVVNFIRRVLRRRKVCVRAPIVSVDSSPLLTEAQPISSSWHTKATWKGQAEMLKLALRREK